jgi:4-hydroxybutyrate CoA-transferase
VGGAIRRRAQTHRVAPGDPAEENGMTWKERYADKLVTPEEAVRRIKTGDAVGVAPFSTTPYTLCEALIARVLSGDLTNIRVDHPAALVSWTEPGLAGHVELHDNYATPPNRAACHAGTMEYLPIGMWRSYEMPAGFTAAPDVYLVPVSPPDAQGYCSFGPGVWFSGTMCRSAKLVIGEVHEDFIRTYGENYVHINDLDLLVEGTKPTGALPAPPPNPEEVATVEVICTLVASELVNDRDTLQMGVGTVSSALGLFLGDKEDLGIQTELITGGIVDLVDKGVVTGKYKSIHKYKVVGSALVALTADEMRRIHDNPVFELYDFGYTDDLRRLIHIENFVTVNNALVVDLTGQVCAESLGHRMYTGVGGQTAFMIAGAYSPGGKSVSVVPSSSVPSATGQRVSRIVPLLDAGSIVTVPRTLVDYVVTEQGIATLRGKTIRERIQEMLSVAHPAFKADLVRQAKELYGV